MKCHEEVLGIIEAKFKEMKDYIDKKVEELSGKSEPLRDRNRGNCESRRRKFVIHGLQEKVDEKAEDLEKKVIDLLKHKLEITQPGMANDMISGTSRMGKPAKNQNKTQDPISKPRPVVLDLLRDKHRSIFLGKLHKLKGSDLKVQPFLTKEEKVIYNELMMKRRKLIKEEKKVIIIDFDQLQVGDKHLKLNKSKAARKEGEKITSEVEKENAGTSSKAEKKSTGEEKDEPKEKEDQSAKPEKQGPAGAEESEELKIKMMEQKLQLILQGLDRLGNTSNECSEILKEQSPPLEKINS